MKKYALILCALLATLMLCACNNSKKPVNVCGNAISGNFSGSKTGDADHFEIDFDVLNTTYTHDFDMTQGESILVHVEKESGNVKITVQNGTDAPIYEGNGTAATDFSVKIPADGKYTVSVSGEKAKGKVTFTRGK